MKLGAQISNGPRLPRACPRSAERARAPLADVFAGCLYKEQYSALPEKEKKSFIHSPSLSRRAAHLHTRCRSLVVVIASCQLLNNHAAKRWLFGICRPAVRHTRVYTSRPDRLCRRSVRLRRQGEKSRPKLYSFSFVLDHAITLID